MRKFPILYGILKLLNSLKNKIFDKVRTWVEKKYLKRIKPKRNLLRFEVHVCDHCNLNCAGCGHFCPIAEKRFVDLNILERDFKRLSELTGRKCEQVDLMGGEPLLHPNIVEIFNIARKYFDGSIRLITNGILLASQPNEFWLSCSKNNIQIEITIYPIKLDVQKIIAYAHDVFGVTVSTRTFSWMNHHRDFTGSQDTKEAFRKCNYGGYCIFLEDGKLCLCSLPLLSKHFNKYFGKNEQKYPEPTEKDYINIFEVDSIDTILKKFTRPIPYCRVCTFSIDHPEWKVSNKDIKEWI
jgi:uncharacterized Fe-S cluster-containing radical SAM superfamily protein